MRRYEMFALALNSVAPIRYLQDSEEIQESGTSLVTLLCIIGGILIGTVALVYYAITRSKSTKHMEKVIL